jgi:hypothetical protein
MGANSSTQDPWWEAWWPEELWPEVTLAADDVKELGKELGRVRQRGIRRVDLVARRQSRTDAPILESLADLYAAFKGLDDEDRPQRFRELLWDGLTKYAKKNGMADVAVWVRDLFFSPDDPLTFVSPGDLLDDVRKRLGYAGRDSSFARLRREEFEGFAAFLVAFVNGEAQQINVQIKADRIKERAEKERMEAERIKKDAREEKKRTKKTQGSSPDKRKRQMQLAREKFIRQQKHRDKMRAEARIRTAIIATVLVVVLGTSVFFYLTDSLPQWLR